MPWGSTVGCCAHLHIELMQAQCEVLFLRYRCSLSTVTIATWRMPHTPATQCLTLAIHSEQCLHTTEQHTHTHHPGSLSPTQASGDSVSRLTDSEFCFSPRIRIVEVMTTQVFFWLTWPTYQSQIAQTVVRQYYVLKEYLWFGGTCIAALYRNYFFFGSAYSYYVQ